MAIKKKAKTALDVKGVLSRLTLSDLKLLATDIGVNEYHIGRGDEGYLIDKIQEQIRSLKQDRESIETLKKLIRGLFPIP